jgi:predicted HicB family RNase H-like nuclease
LKEAAGAAAGYGPTTQEKLFRGAVVGLGAAGIFAVERRAQLTRSSSRSSRILLAVCACIAYTDCMQYTIRGIPAIVDHAIRARARAAGKSLNEAVVDALAEGAGVAGSPRKRRDLGDIAGTWKADKALESALAAQDRVDEDLWR